MSMITLINGGVLHGRYLGLVLHRADDGIDALGGCIGRVVGYQPRWPSEIRGSASYPLSAPIKLTVMIS